ncbi:MAG: septal ring lytic transglycosylase RlpA family protein [Alphaproteobacteria bacterium]|jgi:rare lipoprotein A|nr:septal ring lytic transglycosylase RlpA family protein [Alphaproteobacteria bacterium]
MPLRRTIGISLACFVTSACAMGETPEESPSHILDEATAIPQRDPEPAIDRSRTQFGKAAWYNFVGKKTANGEVLDTVTATAAHRTLPLASYAKVTNLDNSRSVIVKINDRGPYGRGRIIDLSPCAADVLDMKHAGVVAVVIEPLVYEAAPAIAAVGTSDAIVTQ